MLAAFLEDGFAEDEKDIEILVLTLSGIVNNNLEQMEKAKNVSQKTSNWLDRRKWLIIPKMKI